MKIIGGTTKGFEIRKPQGDEKTIFPKGASGFVCVQDGVVVGWILKHRNTKTDIHPYKVFRRAPVGVVEPATMLAVFYTDADVATLYAGNWSSYQERDREMENTKGGGLTAAMVFARRHLRSN